MSQQGLAPQQNIESSPNVIKEKLIEIRNLPEELKGKIPETVWVTLTAQQREEILKQYGIFEKYLQISEKSAAEAVDASLVDQNLPQETTEIPLDQITQQPQVTPAPVVTDVAQQKADNEKMQKEFAQAVAEKQKLEETGQNVNTETPPVQESEQVVAKVETLPEQQIPDQREVGIEKPQMQSKPQVQETSPNQKVVPRFSGYPVSESTARNADEVSKGDPRNGRTWTATLLEKLWALLSA